MEGNKFGFDCNYDKIKVLWSWSLTNKIKGN